MQENTFDARATRERLHLSPESLAAALHVTEGEVFAWENGTLRPTRKVRRRLEHLAARHDWDAGMRASGLPPCVWLDEHLPWLAYIPIDPAGKGPHAEVLAHLDRCEVCLARAAWAREHLGPPPEPPVVGLDRAFRGIAAAIRRLPAWARPPAVGAIALALMTCARILFLIPSMLRSPLAALQAVGIMLLAGAAGSVGGLAYSLTRPTFKRVGWFGNYLSGFLSVVSFLGAIEVSSALISGWPSPRDLEEILVIGAIFSVLFGTVVGTFIQEIRGIRRTYG